MKGLGGGNVALQWTKEWVDKRLDSFGINREVYNVSKVCPFYVHLL